MGRLFKDSKLYAIDSSQSAVKEIAQFYHRGQPVSMMYQGKLVYEASGPSEYVQEGLLFQLDCDDVVDGATSFSSKEGLIYEPITFDMFMVGYDDERRPIYTDHVSKGERGITTFSSESYKSFPMSMFYSPFTIEFCFLNRNEMKGVGIGTWEDDEKEGIDINDAFAEIFGYDYKSYLKDGENTSTIIAPNGFGEGEPVFYVNGKLLPPPIASRMARMMSLNNTSKPTIEGLTQIISSNTELFNVRIYNRALSSTEVKNNYRYDKITYKPILPIPENALVDIDGNYIIDAEGNFIIDNN